MAVRAAVTASDAVDMLSFLAYPPISTTREKSMALIRQWAVRGKVKKLGYNTDGNMRYELADILVMVLRGDEGEAA